MSYDPRDDEAARKIVELREQLKELRRHEKNLDARRQILESQSQYGFTDVQKLRKELDNTLPDYMSPSNVGHLDDVAWFFYEQVNFDFGANPTLTAATRQTQSFQVTQEAGFLVMAVARTNSAYATSGELGPWLVEFRDRQSSRQFNDRPVPIQMIGTKSCPTILPTPMLLLPNAFFDVTMSTFATAQVTVGSSRHQFSFFGYRIRVNDSAKVLSTIFKAY